MNYFIEALKKYAVFSGRARRKEYWMFALFYMIIAIVVVIIEAAIGGQILSILLTVAFFLPGLGVTVRRLHDTGRSGWWVLFALVPLVGSITLIVFMCLDGEQGENKYGYNPKLAPSYA
ncbi:DUF805 domain-containing protein [Streptomyces sp. SID12488]|uniref:DUF805 domain-containing protein n=1 Tax=Streptomyces sp. SID12488 TaxID=2706040 RepID=UPI0013D9AAE1|nr:DUF805 domain-containing protein [Streptomyces sp. SID12488]NEA66549.1 DUF805 domain-containing protein [Streptomyces sp. SID12488]